MFVYTYIQILSIFISGISPKTYAGGRFQNSRPLGGLIWDTVACTNYAYKEGKNNLTNNHAWQRDFSTGSEPVFSFTLSCGTYPSSAEASRSWVIIVVETCWQIAQYGRAAGILQSLKQLARTVVTCRRTEAHNKCFGNRQKMCPLNNPRKWKTVSEFCTRFQFQAQIS